jgi:hypothetical protein
MVDLEEGLLIEVHEGGRGTTKLTAPLGSGEGLFGHKGASAIPLDDGFAHGGLARQASLLQKKLLLRGKLGLWPFPNCVYRFKDKGKDFP